MMDGTESLCYAVYDRQPEVSDYLGGSKAKMLYDAATMIAKLKAEKAELLEDIKRLKAYVNCL